MSRKVDEAPQIEQAPRPTIAIVEAEGVYELHQCDPLPDGYEDMSKSDAANWLARQFAAAVIRLLDDVQKRRGDQ